MLFAQKKKDIETRLSAARSHLILDCPFIGVLALHLEPEPATWCKSFATDTQKFYYNPEYVEKVEDKDLQFMFGHEVLHCALGHVFRRRGRIQQRWDIACDFAVNHILVQEGLGSSQDILFSELYANMSAEEIYSCLDNDDDRETIDEHSWNHQDHKQDSKPFPASISEKAMTQLENQWKNHLVSAAQQARQQGKLSPTLERLVKELIEPKLPWQHLLAHHMRMTAYEDFTYQRPNRRRSGEVIFPSLRSHECHTTVAIDVSGSICDKEMNEFLSEMNAMKSFFKARITLLACDEKLAPGSPWIYEPWQHVELPQSIQGGGGTNFTPVFDWIALQDIQPDLLIYLTDARGRFPMQAPHYPVLWLVKGNEKVPWGQAIQMN
ncbi:MAG: DUF2201 family putative metallopeptidase [Candidatus Oxydemutatoraceae bacterium WSBS_2016_MAG_OTU14]